jgi:hypothetical protein
MAAHGFTFFGEVDDVSGLVVSWITRPMLAGVSPYFATYGSSNCSKRSSSSIVQSGKIDQASPPFQGLLTEIYRTAYHPRRTIMGFVQIESTPYQWRAQSYSVGENGTRQSGNCYIPDGRINCIRIGRTTFVVMDGEATFYKDHQPTVLNKSGIMRGESLLLFPSPAITARCFTSAPKNNKPKVLRVDNEGNETDEIDLSSSTVRWSRTVLGNSKAG